MKERKKTIAKSVRYGTLFVQLFSSRPNQLTHWHFIDVKMSIQNF